MTAQSVPSAKLYTPQILALATTLADYPYAPAWPVFGSARSPTCGATLRLGMRLDDDLRISAIGLDVTACAIGQASAALFAKHAAGHSPSAIAKTAVAVEDWLKESASMPRWPGLELLEPARAHPARYGAIMLPWRAAQHALSNTAASR